LFVDCQEQLIYLEYGEYLVQMFSDYWLIQSNKKKKESLGQKFKVYAFLLNIDTLA
jgi:hypothetical protein